MADRPVPLSAQGTWQCPCWHRLPHHTWFWSSLGVCFKVIHKSLSFLGPFRYKSYNFHRQGRKKNMIHSFSLFSFFSSFLPHPSSSFPLLLSSPFSFISLLSLFLPPPFCSPSPPLPLLSLWHPFLPSFPFFHMALLCSSRRLMCSLLCSLRLPIFLPLTAQGYRGYPVVQRFASTPRHLL